MSEDAPRCTSDRKNGEPCTAYAVVDKESGESLGHCFRHCPDHLTEQAERVTGKRRCSRILHGRNDDGTLAEGYGTRCHEPAITDPEAENEQQVCRVHATASALYRGQQYAVDREARQAVVRYLPGVLDNVTGDDIEMIDNPFEELMLLASEMKAFKDRVGKRVAEMKVDEFRYSGERIGEQLRAEVGVYVGMMDKLGQLLVKITRLNIEARLMRITERQATIIEDAIGKTLADDRLALPAVKQDLARTIVVDIMTRSLDVA
jgi:hypothetical protein